MSAVPFTLTGIVTYNASLVLYQPAGGCGVENSGADVAPETDRQVTYRTAGALSRFAVYKASGDRTGMTERVRINGAYGNGSLAFTSTNGYYEDTNTDSIAVGDKVCFELNTGSGGTTGIAVRGVRALWSASVGTTAVLIANGGGGATSSLANTATAWVPLLGQLSSVTQAQADVEWKVRLPAGVDYITLQNFSVRTSSTTSGGTGTTFSINGASGTGTAPTILVGNGVAGTFEDTTNSIRVLDGDLISVKCVTTKTGGSIGLVLFTIEVVSPTGKAVTFFVNSPAAVGGASLTLTDYTFLSGNLTRNGFETAVNKPQLGVPLRLSMLTTNITTGGTGTSISVRSNVANSDPLLSVDTTGTGWVTDAVNSLAVTSADEIALNVGAGTVAAVVRLIAVTADLTTDGLQAGTTEASVGIV